MKALAAVLGAVAAVFATLPGIATLLDELDTPPGSQKLFGAFLLAFGVITLLLLGLWRDRIRGADRKFVMLSVLICVAISLAAFSYHDNVYRKTIIQEPVARDTTSQTFDTVTVFYPLRLRGDLKEWVELAGGRREVFQYHSVAEVQRETDRYSKSSTLTLLLLLRMGTILPLTAAFAIAGWAALGQGREPVDRSHASTATAATVDAG